MARRRVKQSVTDGEFRKIVGDAKAFLEAAFFMENRVRKLKVDSDTLSPIGGNKGWPSHDVWESLKTVSHFNLHNAFELGLKGFLGSIDKPFANIHSLRALYAKIPEEEADKLSAIFREVAKDRKIELKAFIRTQELSPPPRKPKSVRLSTLKQFFEYFDKDAALWKKRYAWEGVSKEKWEHYIDDLSVFIGFFNEMEKLSIENWNNRQALQS